MGRILCEQQHIEVDGSEEELVVGSPFKTAPLQVPDVFLQLIYRPLLPPLQLYWWRLDVERRCCALLLLAGAASPLLTTRLVPPNQLLHALSERSHKLLAPSCYRYVVFCYELEQRTGIGIATSLIYNQWKRLSPGPVLADIRSVAKLPAPHHCLCLSLTYSPPPLPPFVRAQVTQKSFLPA